MTPLLSSYTMLDGMGRFAYMIDEERAVVEWRDVYNSEKRKISFQVIITVVLANPKHTEWEQLQSYFFLCVCLNLPLFNMY